jgi:hypothetical protein
MIQEVVCFAAACQQANSQHGINISLCFAIISQ